MKKCVVMLACCFLMVSTVYGASLKENCGCGLGSMFFQEQNGLMSQTSAASINAAFGNQAFGISSGTLGCERPKQWVQNKRLNDFVANNMDKLAVDIASGDGESLNALADIIEVPSECRTKFFAVLQDNFDEIYPSAKVTHKDVINKIAKVVQKI